MSALLPYQRIFIAERSATWLRRSEDVQKVRDAVADQIEALTLQAIREGRKDTTMRPYEKDATLKIRQVLAPILRNRPLPAEVRTFIARFGLENVVDVLAEDVWNMAVVQACADNYEVARANDLPFDVSFPRGR